MKEDCAARVELSECFLYFVNFHYVLLNHSLAFLGADLSLNNARIKLHNVHLIPKLGMKM